MMCRRDFLKYCSAASILVSTSASAQKVSNVLSARAYSVDFNFDLTNSNSDAVSLWVPLPLSSDIQMVSEFNIQSTSKNYLVSSNNICSANLLCCKWAKDDIKKIKISFEVRTLSPVFDLTKMDTSAKIDSYIASFVKPSKHIQTDGIVAEISNKICKSVKGDISKARAIYDWVIENMYRDPNVKGCGVGNAKEALEEKRYGGKCLDISAVFVALLRAQNIPAREMMGLRLGPSKISNAFGVKDDISSAQHCRAEFFIQNYGWVRADPADITKLRLQEKLPKSSKREHEISDIYFGSFESNWLKLNHARDFVLFPKPIQFPLDQFNYPYGEMDDEVIDFYEPTTFKYSFKSVEL